MRTHQAAMAAALFALAPLAASAAEPSLNAGDRELEIAASYTSSSPDFGPDLTLLQVQLRHGWFLTSQHEAGVVGSYISADDGSTSISFGQLGGFYDFNFPASGNVVPVVGASLQLAFGDAEGNVMEVSGGFRVFGSESVSVNTRAVYEIADDDGFQTKTLGLRLGLSWIIH